MSFSSDDLKICAVGFDVIGLDSTQKSIDFPQGRIDFLSKLEAGVSNLDYDGYIIPSGIYERFSTSPDKDGPRTVCESNPEEVKGIEAKIIKHLEKGKWLCLTVDEIIDKINEDSRYPTTLVNRTDLAKRVLNRYAILRAREKKGSKTRSHLKAFESYITKYADSSMVYMPPADAESVTVSSTSQGINGFVVARQVFVLPCFRKKARSRGPKEPVLELIRSVEGFLSGRSEESFGVESLPEWTKSLSLNHETQLRVQRDELKKGLKEIEDSLHRVEIWKGVLVFSGESLNNLVADIFEKFFGFHLQKFEQHSEALGLKIESEGDSVLLCGVVSLLGQVKRQDVNHLDSIRESLGLPPDLKALLLVNDRYQAQSLEEKMGGEIEEEKKDHAKKFNMGILRSFDLILMMQEWESLAVDKRREAFIDFVQKGALLPDNLRDKCRKLASGA